MTIGFMIMSYGGLALAVISLGIAIFFFVKWDIPKVIGELTGRSQKRAIEKIRREGYESTVSKKTSIRADAASGNIRAHKTDTDELTSGHTGRTGELEDASATQSTDSSRRSGLKAQENVTNTVFKVYGSEEETSVLGASPKVAEEETTVLGANVSSTENETTVLGATESAGEAETSVLSTNVAESEAETSVLSSNVSASEAETSVLSSNVSASEAETSVLSSSELDGLSAATEEEKVQDKDEEGDELMHPSEESTTILTSGSVEGVINLPNEMITQPGTFVKVLDFVITHTDEEVG